MNGQVIHWFKDLPDVAADQPVCSLCGKEIIDCAVNIWRSGPNKTLLKARLHGGCYEITDKRHFQ
jgi:hypothetical protein